MHMILNTAYGVVLGMICANFLWQFLSGRRNWQTATERSFFQLVAIAIFIVAIALQH